MAITKLKYSVTMRGNTMKPEEPKKAYATLQLNGTVKVEELAKHIKDHGSVYGRDVIIGVTYALVDCVKEYLSQGYAVDLGLLGVFKPGIKSNGVADGDRKDNEGNPISGLKAFGSDDIVGMHVNYTMSKEFEDLRSEARFQKVATRRAQQAAQQAQLNGQTTADWTPAEEEEEEEETNP